MAQLVRLSRRRMFTKAAIRHACRSNVWSRIQQLQFEVLESRHLLTVITGVSPSQHAIDASSSPVISAEFDVNIDPASVSSESFAVHGMQSGQLLVPPNTIDVVGETISLSLAKTFHPGENVAVSATSEIEAALGNGTAIPFVWQFRVAPTGGTGIAPSGRSLETPGVNEIAIGDLDGDGDLDALIGSNAGGSSVWSNDGEGGFSDSGQRLRGPRVTALALGDLDGDGDLDAVIATAGRFDGGANRLWFNDGNGIFAVSRNRLGNSPTNDVALADIDGDGDLDILDSNIFEFDPTRVFDNKVWINDGLGQFTDSGRAVGQNGRTIEVGDLDGDGDLDAVIGTHGQGVGQVEIWLNNSEGVFSRTSQNDTNYASAIALGDLDNDGDVDAFVGRSGLHFEGPFAASSTVLLNGGDGSFTATGQNIGGGQTNAVALADFDADGDLDALLSNGGVSDTPSVWLNGKGRYSEKALPAHVPTSAIAIGDLDGNGSIDALVGAGSRTAIWLNVNRNLDLTVAVDDDTFILAPGEQVVYHINVSNAGPENAEDVVVTDDFPDEMINVRWVCNASLNSSCSASGTGNLLDVISLEAGGTANYTVTATLAADSSGAFTNVATVGLLDGQLDLVPANNSASDTNVVPPLSIEPEINSHSAPTGTLVTVDYPETIDAATVTSESFFVHGSLAGRYVTPTASVVLDAKRLIFDAGVRFQPGERVYVTSTAEINTQGNDPFAPFVWQFRAGVGAGSGRGSGSFVNSRQRIGGSVSRAVSLADLDGDGDLDAITSSFSAVRIWLNEGGIMTDSGRNLGGSSTRVAIGDLDGDGDLDVVSDGRVWMNSGNADFEAAGSVRDPWSLVVGDVDGDGDLDLLSSSSLFRNDGTGNFVESVQDFAFSSIVSIALEDFDGDGDLDAYFGNLGAHAGGADPDQVWLNDGSGRFHDSGQRIGDWRDGTLATTDSLAVGDVDRDGDLDVVTATNPSFVRSPPGMRLWLNDGQGRFSHSTQVFDESARGVSDVKLADIDGDGDLDLVASLPGRFDEPGQNDVWLNDGRGRFFAPNSRLIANRKTNAIAVGDLDGNGSIDVFFANDGVDEVWFNTEVAVDLDIAVKRDRAFVSPGQMATYTVTVTNQGPRTADGAVVIVEFADELTDLIWSCETTSGSTCQETGTGSITDTIVLRPNATAVYTATGVISASARGRVIVNARITPPTGVDDLNQDNNGVRDVGIIPPVGLIPNANSHTAPRGSNVSAAFLDDVDPTTVSSSTFVVHGAQSGKLLEPQNNFSASTDTATVTPARPFHPGELVQVSLRGIKNNSGIELAPIVWQFRASPDGGTGVFENGGGNFGDFQTGGVAVADLDNDHDLDILVTSNRGSKVWLNDSTGNFVEGKPTPSIVRYGDADLGDIDGDGDLDVILQDGIWTNQGDGSFRKSSVGSPGAATLGDLDGDGDLDAFTRATGVGANEVWLNDGHGRFSDTGQRLGNSGTETVGLADFDGDGDLDAVVGNNENGVDEIWLNDGFGVFTLGLELGNSQSNSAAVAIADVSGDGLLDILLGGSQSFRGLTPTGGVNVWYGDGDGGFSAMQRLGHDSFVSGVELGDVDGDGDLDLFAVGFRQNHLWLNNGTGRYVDSGQALGRNTSISVALGDLDGDGDLDAFVGNHGQDVFWRNVGAPTQDRLAGDANEDGEVAFADFLLLSLNFGKTDSTWRDGDFNDDGQVTFEDFLILSANFGSTRPQVLAAILSDKLQFENPDSANSSAADDLFERFDDELSLDTLV